MFRAAGTPRRSERPLRRSRRQPGLEPVWFIARWIAAVSSVIPSPCILQGAYMEETRRKKPVWVKLPSSTPPTHTRARAHTHKHAQARTRTHTLANPPHTHVTYFCTKFFHVHKFLPWWVFPYHDVSVGGDNIDHAAADVTAATPVKRGDRSILGGRMSKS
jgi:hypothetical protein